MGQLLPRMILLAGAVLAGAVGVVLLRYPEQIKAHREQHAHFDIERWLAAQTPVSFFRALGWFCVACSSGLMLLAALA